MGKGNLRSVDVLSHSQPSPWRSSLLLAAALAVCLGVRVWLVFHTETITKDGVGYIEMASRWSADPVDALENVSLQPGYPAAISWVHAVIVSFGGPTDITGWDLAGQMTSLVASVAAMLAVWFFACALMNRRIALIAVLLFSLAHKWSADGADVLADPLAVCLQMWAMVTALWALRLLRSGCVAAMCLAAVTGVLSAGAYYVRTEAVHVAVVIAVCWLICGGLLDRKLAPALAATGVMLLIVVICTAPFMFWIGAPTNDAVFANFTAQRRGPATPADVPPATVVDEVEDHADEAPGPLSRLCAGLNRFVGQLFEAMHPVLGFAMCTWLITWIGAKVLRSRLLAAMAGSPRLPAGLLLVGSLVIMGLATITNYLYAGYMSHRYLLVNAAMLSPLGAAGIVVLVHWICILAQKLRLPVFPRATILAVVIPVAVGLLWHTLKPLHEGKAYVKQAGLCVAQQAHEGDFLITDRALILHYAQVDGKHLAPPIRIDRLQMWVSRPDWPATIVAMSDRYLPDKQMALSEYLGGQSGSVLLGRYVRDDQADGDSIVVFRLDESQ